jgi:hypothetical protein
MTHDELLADIDKKILLSEHTIYPIYMQAFRAVVELHAPDYMGCCDNNCCGSDACSSCLNAYPCPTIEAIEKELGSATI